MKIIHFAGLRTNLQPTGLFLIAILLQGCAGPGPLSRFIYNQANGVIGFPTAVESAQFDSARKEFTICISGLDIAAKDKFTMIIPDDLVAKEGNDQATISKENEFDYGGVLKKGELFQEAYKVSARVEQGCRIGSASSKIMPIFQTPKLDDAVSKGHSPPYRPLFYPVLSFDKETISKLIAKANSFVVLIPYWFHVDLSPKQHMQYRSSLASSCGRGWTRPCILMAARISSANQGDDEIRKGPPWEIFSIEEITSNEHANLLWYAALPFVNVIEFALMVPLGAFIVLGSAIVG